MSLPAASFAICSFSISLSKFMADSPSAAQASRRSDQAFDRGAKRVGELLRQSAGFVTSPSLAFRRFPKTLQKGGPQVRPPLSREPFGLGASPGGDLGVVARNQDLRDRPAFPQLRAGKMRIFEQSLGEAFIGGRTRCAHDAGQ